MEGNQNLVFRNFSLKWPKNIVKEPNCYKSLINTNYIDLVITNSSSSFQNTKTFNGIIGFSQNGYNCFKTIISKIFPKSLFIENTKNVIGLNSKES